MPHVVVAGPLHPSGRARLDAAKDVTVTYISVTSEKSLAAEISDADAVLLRTQPMTAPTIAKGERLKIVSRHGVGYDAVDTDACVARGIKVSHTPDVLNGEVANTTLLLMLAGLRNFRHDEAWARSGDWEAKGGAPLSTSPDGKTIGILGLGRIGQEIADRLAVFNPTIVYHTRTKKDVPYTYYDDLVEMAKACDVLVCITPGGASTNKIVNKDVLEALGPKGMLINVSRGSVVDEDALIAALESGKLGLAGLDVFEGEPHIPDALKASERTVLLPHVGSATHETRAAMGALTVDNLLQWKADGTLKTPVPECAHL